MFGVPRLLALLAGLAIVSLSGAQTAHAGKFPIPCTGDRIVRVVDIPDLHTADNTQIDLGYLFEGCFGKGKWIGHIGQSDKYIELNGVAEAQLLAAAGLSQLPPAPSRWDYALESLALEGFWAGGVLLVIAWTVFGGMKSGEKTNLPKKSVEPNKPKIDPHF